MVDEEQEVFYPNPEEVAAVVVTPEIFSDEKIVRRVQIVSVTVQAGEAVLRGASPDKLDPMEYAQEALAGKAARLGANAVIGVEALPMPSTVGEVRMDKPTKTNATGHIGGKTVAVYVPAPSRQGTIKTKGNILVWGLAVVIN